MEEEYPIQIAMKLMEMVKMELSLSDLAI